MNPIDLLDRVSGRLDPRAASALFSRLERIPGVRRVVERELSKMLDKLEPKVKPYKGKVASHVELPETGVARETILEEMARLAATEEPAWREGRASGAVYHGDQEHIDFVNRVYALCSQTNPLHSDIWPSIAKYEAEIVSMTARMLGADAARTAEGDEIAGAVSSGGTESILLAIKTYRDQATATRRIRHPELVLPTTAHVAFDKAGHYFGVKLVRVPVGKDLGADVDATRRAITRNTIALVGSAPSFPHGVIDPIAPLSELAQKHGVGMHVDACLGGFVLPWAERLGYPVPAFDFRLPGVTSMSVDTHKYGYAPKGTSVVLYRGAELRRFQYFTATDWPGGLYFSPTLAGSRPGALSAACWATLLSVGEHGYLEATRRILETAARIKAEIAAIPELKVIGNPLFVVAFASEQLDIYRVMDAMAERRWSLNGLHQPPCLHLAVTLRHTQPGLVERFASDLRASVEEAKKHAGEPTGMAPVYGLAARLPVRSLVGQMLQRYMDLLYRV